MNYLDLLGWGGAVGLLLFYWLMGSQRIMPAYIAGTLGGVCWFIIGIVTWFWDVSVSLPSLAIMEAMVITLNVRAMWRWHKKKVIDK